MKTIDPFSHNKFLGYVCEITPQYISIQFPSTALLRTFYYNGDFFGGGNVGNFVVIEGSPSGFLARIISLELPQSERKEVTEKAIQNSDTEFHPMGKAELLLAFNVYSPEKVEHTCTSYPVIGAKVFSCSDEQIKIYIAKFGIKKNEKGDLPYAEIGKLVSNDAICNVSLNSLFERHCAVVGTTGSGKSWTIAKLIECMEEQTTNKMILIDPTGEYKDLSSKDYSMGKNSYFNYKELSNSQFCSLFREHSPNSSSVLCDALNTLRLFKKGYLESKIKIGKKVTDIESIVSEHTKDLVNSEFDITELPNQIRNECVKQDKSGNYASDDFKLGYCSHLIGRVNNFLNNIAIKLAFGIEKHVSKCDIIDSINNFCNKDNKDNNNDNNGNNDRLLRIGFETLPYDFAIREVVVDFIANKLLNEARKDTFRNSPLVLFIDEAHQFLNKKINADDDTELYLQNIELIAKETRKYGLFLCLSTQMPRDIPIGILSQMGTFIVHRLINELDKKAVMNATQSASGGLLSFLPVLGEGEVILFGIDFPMPLLLKIDAPKKAPNSNTPKLSIATHITK